MDKPRKGSKDESAPLEGLSPRARQAMEIIYRRGEATVAEILEESELIPSYSAARSVLRGLKERGLVRHFEKGMRYVYRPVKPKSRQKNAALAAVIRNFFDGSAEKAMKAMIDLSRTDDVDLDLDRLEQLIHESKTSGESS